MRKIVSMSALLSGLLAGPLLAGAKTAEASNQAVVAEMQAHLAALNGGAPMNAQRMQSLHRHMLADVQAQIARALANAASEQNPENSLIFVDNPVLTSSGGGLIFTGPVNPSAPQMEKAAFLGVATSPVTSTLQEQLKLHRGMGLVIELVIKDSPAANAGLRAHDILEKLDDQWLVNGPQFAALVRARQPGESIALTIIRNGDRQVVNVKLAEKELPVLDPQDLFRFPGNPQGMIEVPIDGSAGWQRGIRKTIATSPNGAVTRTLIDGQNEITLTTDPDGQSVLIIKDTNNTEHYHGPYTTDDDKTKVPAQYADAVKNLVAGSPRVTLRGLNGTASPPAFGMHATRADAEHEITLTLTNQGKSAVVKDVKTGTVLYEGPVNTDDELKSLPAGVADKIKTLEAKMNKEY